MPDILRRIGFFTPSMGLESSPDCLEFVKKRGGLIQAWTLSPRLAHEVKPGITPDDIFSELAGGHIRVSSLSGYMDWTTAVDNGARINEFKRLIAECGTCHTTIICTETGRNFTDRDGDKDAWNMLVDSMKLLCAEAERKHVVIAIEMGRLDLIYGAEYFRRLQDKVGSSALKINFDPANLRRGDLDPIKQLNVLKDDVVQVHLKDADANGMAPLTRGDVDFLKLFRMMEEYGYAGNYIIEQEYAHQNCAAAVAEDYENIVRLIEQK